MEHYPLLLFLGSAGVGALVSAVVNGAFNYFIKKREMDARDMELALKMAELKHEQLVTAQEWAVKAEGKPRPAGLWDPLMSVIDYLEGAKEYRKTGKWKKGEESHRGEEAQPPKG